jgi:hypothetical protein
MVAIATAPTRFPSRPVLVVLPPVTRPGARIYRRRRLAVLGAALSVVLLAVLLTSLAGRATSSDVRIAPAEAPIVRNPAAYGASGQRVPARAVYVVQPGDTIWTIARDLDPSGDTRATVDRIVALNGSAALEPGQRLRLTDSDH